MIGSNSGMEKKNEDRIARVRTIGENSETIEHFMENISGKTTEEKPQKVKAEKAKSNFQITETEDAILIEIKFDSKATLKIYLNETEEVSGNAGIVKKNKEKLLQAIARNENESNQNRVLRIESVAQNGGLVDSNIFLEMLSQS